MSFLTSLRTGASSVFSWMKIHWKLTIAIVVIGLPILAAILFAFSPGKIDYVTEPAKRETLTQLVEANGTVTSDRDIDLKFPAVSGVVDNVYVKEGDTVRAGQRLATLKAGSLGAAVASASASLQAQQAQLQLMIAGASPEDIAVAQATLQSKQAALQVAQQTLQTSIDSVTTSQQQLDALQSQLDVSLAGSVSEAPSTIAKNLSSAQAALVSLDSIFVKTDVQDALYRSANGDRDVQAAKTTAQASIAAAIALNPTDVQSAIADLQQAKIAAQQASTALQIGYALISGLTDSSSYTATEREADKSTLASAQTSVQTAISSLDASLSALQSASAGNQTQIVTAQSNLQAAKNARDKAQSDILTYQAAIQIAQAQLNQTQAGSRPQDIAAQQARVRQAQAELARAASSYNDTILTAPIDGKITKVLIKKGEYTPVDAAMTLIGNSPYRIEMYVSEIDVPKVQVTQSGSIELDAFRGTPMKLRVSEIDTAATDRDGVPKYKVTLDFVYTHTDLKIGMTGDANITTGTRDNVVTVPARAVLQDDQGRSYVRILTSDNKVEQRIVTTGLDGSNGEIEVDGVNEGENVIVLQKTQ